jgi:prepilin-type N-terminal cleavage/methylation domain-containing protein
MTLRRHRGFSLLELLVTLFVIVLVTSLVSLTVSSGGQDIQLEARVRNLADVASYALDEAQLTGTDYGLLLRREIVEGDTVYRYDWRARMLPGWQAPEGGKDVFAGQTLPAGLELSLALEDSPVTDIEFVGADDETPQLVFYSIGETTAGSIEVRRQVGGELLWRVEWDLLGRFTVLPRGEEPDAALD